MAVQTVQRRYDLNWLRVLAFLLVFVNHSTRFFNFYDWHIRNQVAYGWVHVFEVLMEFWMIPFILLISGARIFSAMNKGEAVTFFKGKTLRLFIPLLAAVFTYASLQVYLQHIRYGQFGVSFFA